MTIIDPNKSTVTTSKKPNEKLIEKSIEKSIENPTIKTKEKIKSEQKQKVTQKSEKTPISKIATNRVTQVTPKNSPIKPTLNLSDNGPAVELPKIESSFGFIASRPGLKSVNRTTPISSEKIEYKPRVSLSLVPKKQATNSDSQKTQESNPNQVFSPLNRQGLKLVKNDNPNFTPASKNRTNNFTTKPGYQANKNTSHFTLTPAEVIEEIQPKITRPLTRPLQQVDGYKPMIFSDDEPITPNLGIYEKQTPSIRGVINRPGERNTNFETKINSKRGVVNNTHKFPAQASSQPDIRLANLSKINQSNGIQAERPTNRKPLPDQQYYPNPEFKSNLDNLEPAPLKAAVSKPSPKPILRRVATPTIKKDPSTIKAKGTNNYAFIDCQNLWYNLDKDWQLDWTKFFEYLKNQLGVKRGYVFIGFVAGYQKMYQQLQEAGFILIFKPVQETSTGIKCNVDTEMVLQTMIQIGNFDKAVIVTGDGDFTCLVEHLWSVKKLEAVMIPGTRSYSHTLEKAGQSKVVFISMLKDKLQKDAANLDDYVPMIISE